MGVNHITLVVFVTSGILGLSCINWIWISLWIKITFFLIIKAQLDRPPKRLKKILCFGDEESRDRYVGWSVCQLGSTQLSKKFGGHHAWSLLYRLCTLSRVMAQYMVTNSYGQNTVRNRARILAWASTLQSFSARWWLAMTYSMGIMGIMGNESDQKISPPTLSRLKHIPVFLGGTKHRDRPYVFSVKLY